MHKVQLNKNCILIQIIQQYDHTIVKSLLDRIAAEAGVQLNCNRNFMAKERTRDNKTENKALPDATVK